MKRKSPTTERRLTQAAEKALSGANLADDSMGNAFRSLAIYYSSQGQPAKAAELEMLANATRGTDDIYGTGGQTDQ